MENVTRLQPAEDLEDERRARFAPLVVAYFLRAIDSLSATPRGPQLAVRRVWSPEMPAQPEIVRRHPWQ